MEKEILKLEKLLRDQAGIKAERFIANCFGDCVTSLHEIDGIVSDPGDMETKYFTIDEIVKSLEKERDIHTVIDGKVNKYHILQAVFELERQEIEEFFFMEYIKKLENDYKK